MLKKIESFEGENHYLSNFFNAPVKYDGIFYLNNEAAFQSAKVLSKEERLEFEILQPNDAKRLGRKVKLRKDWEQVKDQVMYDCVKDKFERNEELKKKLLSTGQTQLIEGNWWDDTYWGVCEGKGQNKLGKILMQVREEFKTKKN
jgi:ribA/ribD-fused uncharacterized protein